MLIVVCQCLSWFTVYRIFIMVYMICIMVYRILEEIWRCQPYNSHQFAQGVPREIIVLDAETRKLPVKMPGSPIGSKKLPAQKIWIAKNQKEKVHSKMVRVKEKFQNIMSLALRCRVPLSGGWWFVDIAWYVIVQGWSCLARHHDWIVISSYDW